MLIDKRAQFVELLKRKGVHGPIAEIGVDEGKFSELFFDSGCFREIWLVDNWEDAPFQDGMNYKYMLTTSKFSRDPRVKVIRLPSLRVASMLPNGYFDFIYIDAMHTEKDVYEDCEAWYPKLKIDGIFAGHDYDLEPVRSAVTRFSQRIGHDISLTDESSVSWYFTRRF